MKEELSDFLKIAYQYGKVREVNEAFEEYPVEEEWHKGEVLVKEEGEVYSFDYEIGDIVFVKQY